MEEETEIYNCGLQVLYVNCNGGEELRKFHVLYMYV